MKLEGDRRCVHVAEEMKQEALVYRKLSQSLAAWDAVLISQL